MAELAVYEINDYLWGATELRSIMGYSPGSERPFRPVQQVPESNSTIGAKPYIVYTALTAPDPAFTDIHIDTILYMIWGETHGLTVKISNEIIRHLRKGDESATLVNDYLRVNSRNSGHEFLNISFNNVAFPDPVTQEGGLFGKPVSIRSSYLPLNLC